MPQSLHRLSAKAVENARPNTSMNDGGGLFLRVGAKGNKFWVYRYKLKGVPQRNMGIGAYPNVSLAQARQKANQARDLVSRGLDPIEESEKHAAATQRQAEAESRLEMTFGKYATEIFLPAMLKRFTNDAHIQQWEATFRTHSEKLNDKPLVQITRKDILKDVLEPIWETKNVTATRVRERLERLFSHAIQNGAFEGDNPAAWRQFDETLARPKKLTRGHHAALTHEQLPDFISALRAKQAVSTAAYMLEWIILSACRTGEARFATWSEIDLDRKVWSIPAKRMKMRRDHSVPITNRMEEILDAVTCNGLIEPGPEDFIFPGQQKGKPQSEMAAMMLMRRMGYGDYTVHGMRAAFKGWAATVTEYPRELIEEQLAHQLGAVEQAYMRLSTHERRRPMMETWNTAISDKTEFPNENTI